MVWDGWDRRWGKGNNWASFVFGIVDRDDSVFGLERD